MPETFTLDSPLDATHVRLLQWLRHYPFQRLEDLVVGLGTWSGRTTIYTHLKDLEDAQFVERLQGFCPGKALYHLSPVGLTWYLLATQGERDAQTMREARVAERTALLRLLPRVPAWLILQTVINGLVSGAAETLTRQGRRAHLVRWNWQRDAIHAFTSQGHPMRWFAESVGAFCLRYAARGEETQECWYRFFLLFLPFTHPRLMRARLDRFLRWREASERWQRYTQMPPILILATTPRQADWWQQAAARVTQELGIAPPLGAIAQVAPLPTAHHGEGVFTDPWTQGWRRLGSQQMTHVRDLFAPQDDPGFPDLFPQETVLAHREAAVLLAQNKTLLPPPRARRFQFAHERQEQRGKLGKGARPDGWRRACLTLTTRQWELLALLLAHPLLDRGNLGAHLHLERSSVRHLLAPLIQMGLVASYETRVGERFALAEAGLRLMAAAARCHVRYLAHRAEATNAPDPFAGMLVPRGLPGLLAQIEHLAGIYGFFELLVPLGGLRWWETGSLCTRFYPFQGTWYGLRPDAVAEWASFQEDCPAHPWRFFLEWDRGTMRAGELRRKMSAYARYLSSHEWAREYQTPPALLCVLPDVGQERALSRVALAQLAPCPVHVALYTTTRRLLISAGLAAAIWRQVLPARTPTAEEPRLVRLFPTRGATEECAQESGA